MSSSQFTYHNYQTVGPAAMLFWDPVKSAYRRVCKISDAQVLASAEKVVKEEVIKGIREVVDERNLFRRWRLRGRLDENANPDVSKLLFASRADMPQSIYTAFSILQFKEVIKLYGENIVVLSHTSDIISSLAGGRVVTGVPFDGNGNIAPGTYYYLVTGVYGTTETVYEASAESQAVVVSAPKDSVALSWTASSDGLPDKFRIYRTTTQGTYGANSFIGETTSTNFVDTLATPSAGAPPSGMYLTKVEKYDLSAIYQAGVDYNLDSDKGEIKRIASGSIGEGESVIVTYFYRNNAMVSTNIDPVEASPVYKKVLLIQMEKDKNGKESGIEIEFYKVNITSGEIGFPFTEDQFNEGVEFEWDCLYDSTSGKVGVRRDKNAVLEHFTLDL